MLLKRKIVLAAPPAQERFGGRWKPLQRSYGRRKRRGVIGPFRYNHTGKNTKNDTENEKIDLPATGGGAELADPLEVFNRRLLCPSLEFVGTAAAAEPGSTVIVVIKKNWYGFY